MLGPLDQVGSQRVAFHIPADGQEMFILLDGERLVKPLVEVAESDAVAVEVPSAHVGGREALETKKRVILNMA